MQNSSGDTALDLAQKKATDETGSTKEAIKVIKSFQRLVALEAKKA